MTHFAQAWDDPEFTSEQLDTFLEYAKKYRYLYWSLRVPKHEQLPLTLSAPNFRRHLSSALFFNKLLIGKKFICKVERLNVKQRRS